MDSCQRQALHLHPGRTRPRLRTALKRLKAHLQELEDKKLISVTRHFDGRITFIDLDSSRPNNVQIRRKTKRLRLNWKDGAL